MRYGLIKSLAIRAALVCPMGVHAAPQTYSVEVIKSSAANLSFWGINDKNQIVGTQYSPDNLTMSGMLYQHGSYQSISGPTGALGSEAYGITSSGTIVGSYATKFTTSADGFTDLDGWTGFVLKDGVYSTFAVPNADTTFLRGVSSDGRFFAGNFTTTLKTETSSSVTQMGFVFDNATGRLLQVSPSQQHNILTLSGVNNAGMAVGNEWILDEDRLTGRVGVTFDALSDQLNRVALDDQRASFRGINDIGTIAGFSSALMHPVQYRPMVYSGGQVAHLDFAITDQAYASGINNSNVIVGSIQNLDGWNSSFIATPVPEPQTISLLLAGLALLAVAYRRPGRSVGARWGR